MRITWPHCFKHISFKIFFRALCSGLNFSPLHQLHCFVRITFSPPSFFSSDYVVCFSHCAVFLLVHRRMAGSDRDPVGWFCGFAFVFSSQRGPLWPLVGLSHPIPPAVFSRATSSAMLRSCDCVSCFAMKVPISLLLRLLGRWHLFLRFALLQLRDARSLSRPSRDASLVSSRTAWRLPWHPRLRCNNCTVFFRTLGFGGALLCCS